MAIFLPIRDTKVDMKSTFSEIKEYLESKGQVFQESRTHKNGEDVFYNGRKAGVLLFDGETEGIELDY